MNRFEFKGLLQNKSWMAPAFVEVDELGKILSIGKEAAPNKVYEKVDAYALPGMQNGHSHAFQYAMAGLNERHDLSKNPDDFWSWRTAMYQIALSINPEQMEVIASMLYAEMLRHGYTSVAEFHYVHHDKNGSPYSNLAELGERLVAAAKKTGIKITLIPIFYQKGGFGKAAEAHQRRFISANLEDYLVLFEASKQATAHYKDAKIAYGVHSLRAVEPEAVKQLSTIAEPNLPFHLHISEQKKEVADALVYLQQRPVEWLCENIDLNDNYHLVHATHLSDKEIVMLAKSQANVVLCPSTEGNLGDGIFPLRAFQKEGGKWSIGTNSHVGINPFEELRILDYGQRLTTHKRNTFYSSKEGDSAIYAFNQCVPSGRKAMGKNHQNFFEVGNAFDAIIIDANAPIIASSSLKNLTSTILYSSDISMQCGTIVNGKWIVKSGKHLHQDTINQSFIKIINTLKFR